MLLKKRFCSAIPYVLNNQGPCTNTFHSKDLILNPAKTHKLLPELTPSLKFGEVETDNFLTI